MANREVSLTTVCMKAGNFETLNVSSWVHEEICRNLKFYHQNMMSDNNTITTYKNELEVTVENE